MKITKVGKKVYLIDVGTGKINNFFGTYILKGERSAIIETGPTSSVSELLSGLNILRIKTSQVAYIAVSHIHLDHAGGVGTILKYLPNAEVVVHERGIKHLVNPKKLWAQSNMILGKTAEIYGAPEPIPEKRIKQAKDGMILELDDNISIEIIETIGHSSHHQSFFYPQEKSIFPGDAAGIYLMMTKSVLPTTPQPFYLESAISSLGKLIDLKPQIMYYSHFGKAFFALKRLEAHIKQLKNWMKITKQGLKEKKSIKEIGNMIRIRDEDINKSWNYLNLKPFLNKLFFESLEGFIDYALKESKK